MSFLFLVDNLQRTPERTPLDLIILCILVGQTSTGRAGQGPREGGVSGAEEEGGARDEGVHVGRRQVHQPGSEKGGEEGRVGGRTGGGRGGSDGHKEEEKSGLCIQRLQRMVNISRYQLRERKRSIDRSIDRSVGSFERTV